MPWRRKKRLSRMPGQSAIAGAPPATEAIAPQSVRARGVSPGVREASPRWSHSTSSAQPWRRKRRKRFSSSFSAALVDSPGWNRRSTVNSTRSGTDVEVDPSAAGAADQQDRLRSLTALIGIREAPRLDLSLQLLQQTAQLEQALEGVAALMLERHVRHLAMHAQQHRERSAVAVPDGAAGRLGHQHPERVLRQRAAAEEVLGAGAPAGLLVGHDGEQHASAQVSRQRAQRGERQQHRHQAPLHVGRAPAAREIALDAPGETGSGSRRERHRSGRGSGASAGHRPALRSRIRSRRPAAARRGSRGAAACAGARAARARGRADRRAAA